MQEVTLNQMLSAREDRALRQAALNREYGLPILSFSMNIPGPVKDSPLIRRGFLSGCRALDEALPTAAIRFRKIFPAVTGWEALYVLNMDAVKVKAIAAAIEDRHGLGRLFDMDVLDEALRKLDRELVGGKSRDCIVCGAPGRGCASRRIHTVPQLQEAVRGILTRYFAAADAQAIGDLAVKSLLEEVDTTPKPGLVDRNNQGSHRDMTVSTFYRSANALAPYFCRCVQLGQETRAEPPRKAFSFLREAGIYAEKEMFAATGGVNTHKGAIFTIGILCGAVGRLWKPEGGFQEGAIFAEVAAMTADAMEEDFRSVGEATAGARLYRRNGIRGIRGEVARGLPTVSKIGLPAYREYRSRGLSPNDAGAVTLLHLIVTAEDTCLLHRGGVEGAAEAKRRVSQLLDAERIPEISQIEALDQWFIQRNLSPGGCADLLAAVYFLQSLSDLQREAEGMESL